MVTEDPMALLIRVGVLTLVSWLNSQSGSHTVMVTYSSPLYNWLIYLLSPVTIPQVVAVNANVFLINLAGKIWVK